MPNSSMTPPTWTHEQRLPSLVVRGLGPTHRSLTLSRPEVHNALDAPLVTLLNETLKHLPSSVRTVVLEGAGPSFCAGADLRGWDAHADKEPVRAEDLAELLRTMRSIRPVVVAKVHGVAAAGGAGIVAAADLVIASQSARFRFPEARLGLVPAVISPYVERALGASRTRYLFLTGAFLSASEACAAGLVHRCVAEDHLEDAVGQVLQALWQAGPQALAECKWLLDALPGLSASERDQRCQLTLERVRASAEAHEGIRAFFARDQPNWVPS